MKITRPSRKPASRRKAKGFWTPDPKNLQNLASLNQRWFAFLIDEILMLPLIGLMLLEKNKDMVNHPLFPLLAILGVVSVGLSFYSLVLLITEGQTIGKRLMKIRIVRLDTGKNGGFLTNVVIRGFFGFAMELVKSLGLAHLGSAIFLADTLFIFRKDRRCLHDFIATTRVVKAEGPFKIAGR